MADLVRRLTRLPPGKLIPVANYTRHSSTLAGYIGRHGTVVASLRSRPCETIPAFVNVSILNPHVTHGYEIRDVGFKVVRNSSHVRRLVGRRGVRVFTSSDGNAENADTGGDAISEAPLKVEVSPNLTVSLGTEARQLTPGGSDSSSTVPVESGPSLIEINERRRKERKAAAAAASTGDSVQDVSAGASAGAGGGDQSQAKPASPAVNSSFEKPAPTIASINGFPLNEPATGSGSGSALGSAMDDAAYASMLRKAAAAAAAWRQAMPFALSEFFFDPDGRSLPKGRKQEEQLIHDIYFKAENGRPREQLDVDGIRAKVLSSSGFVEEVAVSPRQCQQGVVFYGRLAAPATQVYREVQSRLDALFPNHCAVLARDDIIRPAISLLIAPRQHLLSFSLPRPVLLLLSLLTLTTSLLFLCSSISTDPSLSPSLSSSSSTLPLLLTNAVTPLGLLLVAAAGALGRSLAAKAHGISDALDLPLPLPSPSFGFFGLLAPYKALLPNRTALLDLSLASALSSFSVSILLILLGSSNSADFSISFPALASILPPLGSLSAPLPLSLSPALVTIPSTMFVHSHTLSSLSTDLASAVLLTSSSASSTGTSALSAAGATELAINPLVLAGLLGINASALSLLPVGILDGGRIVTALLGRKAQHALSLAMVAAVVASAVFRPDGRVNAGTWVVLALVLLRRDDWFQREEVSEPSSVRKVVAALMVASSIFVLWP